MDKLIKVGFKNIPVRLILVNLSDSWQKVQLNNSNAYSCHQLLGEALAASSLLISNIKFNGSVSLQINTMTHHDLSLLMVECNSSYGVRGLVHLNSKEQQFSTRDLSSNDAHFMVNLLPTDRRLQPYQAVIPLKINEQGFSIQAAISDYMQMSEQIDTNIWLAANGHRSVGMLLQKIPTHGGYGIFDEDYNTILHLANTIKKQELLEWDLHKVIRNLFNEYVEQEKVSILSEHDMHFYCTCSLDRAINAIKIAQRDGLDDKYFLNHQSLDVDCEFCNKKYSFNLEEYKNINKIM